VELPSSGAELIGRMRAVTGYGGCSAAAGLDRVCSAHGAGAGSTT
jgi:hypothetical protein